MTKLVIIVGDYSGGTAENAFQIGKDLHTLRSGDSADGRVFNELIRQDPSVSHVITLPVARQFSSNSASAITKESLEWAFNLLENPKSHPGYEDVTEVSIMANVAPGIKSNRGTSVGQDGNNQDRESFVSGTVTKNGKTIVLGSTNAFLDGEGHTLGFVTDLEKNGYIFSDFKAIGGDYAAEQLKRHGQFRSRWALAYMNAQGAKVERKGGDVLPRAREEHEFVPPELKDRDEREANEVFANMKRFVPVRSGDARKGFVTVISSSLHIDSRLDHWRKSYPDQLINGLSFDGNEIEEDHQIIRKLPSESRAKYQKTRQAFLAATLANEFDREHKAGQRTVIIDDASLRKSDYYEVELQNGAHIITGNPELLALTLDTIQSISKNGEIFSAQETGSLLKSARKFHHYLLDKAVEIDPYRNIKLGATFGEMLKEVHNKLKEAGITEITDDKVVALEIVGKTGAREETRPVYYVPASSGSFGIWGHTKLSAGSSRLKPGDKREDCQAEFFTPGCATAGADGTFKNVIPGVTSFRIEKAVLADKSVLKEPGTLIAGTNRVLPDGARYPIKISSTYHNVHKLYLKGQGQLR